MKKPALERRPCLDGDVVQAAVVEDAQVSADRLVERGHVHRDALGDDRGVGDRQLHLIGHQGLPDVALEQNSIWPGVWLETPNARTLPAACSSSKAFATSSGSTRGIGAMQQQDVDVVGVQGLQGALDALDDVGVGEVEVRPVPDDAGLGLEG